MMTTDELRELEQKGERLLSSKHRSLPRMDREEVLQDALILLVRKVDAGEADTGLLATIIDGKVKDRQRKAIRRTVSETVVPDTSVFDSSTTTIRSALFAVDFDRAVRALDAPLRDAFILYHLRGVTEYEAARLLGIPAGTVVSRAELARKALAEAM